MTQYMTFWCTIVLITALCRTSWSATLILRNGKKLSGDVLSKTDDYVVLKTPAGLVTQQWRACTPATIKALHPALYHRLLKEAEARKKKFEEDMAAKGFVKVDGKWINKDEHLRTQLHKVRLFVEMTESADPYQRLSSSGSGWLKSYKRNAYGVLSIKLDGLNNKADHRLKVLYSHYAEEAGNKFTTDAHVSKLLTIHKEASAELRIKSAPVQQHKQTMRDTSGTSQIKFGAKCLGWDISIWLDDILIYEVKLGSPPQFYHVQKW